MGDWAAWCGLFYLGGPTLPSSGQAVDSFSEKSGESRCLVVRFLLGAKIPPLRSPTHSRNECEEKAVGLLRSG